MCSLNDNIGICAWALNITSFQLLFATYTEWFVCYSYTLPLATWCWSPCAVFHLLYTLPHHVILPYTLFFIGAISPRWGQSVQVSSLNLSDFLYPRQGTSTLCLKHSGVPLIVSALVLSLPAAKPSPFSLWNWLVGLCFGLPRYIYIYPPIFVLSMNCGPTVFSLFHNDYQI